jgi:hypothetical protein
MGLVAILLQSGRKKHKKGGNETPPLAALSVVNFRFL